MLGNPQISLLTPFILLDLIFGPVIGARLQIVAHIAVGFGGAYVLGSRIGNFEAGCHRMRDCFCRKLVVLPSRRGRTSGVHARRLHSLSYRIVVPWIVFDSYRNDPDHFAARSSYFSYPDE